MPANEPSDRERSVARVRATDRGARQNDGECSPRGTSGRAVAADQVTVLLPCELAAMVNEEALRTGELVGLPRQDTDRELFVGQVGAGKLEGLRELGLVDVDDAGRLVHPAVLQLLDRVLGQLVVGLAWCVVVSCHRWIPLAGHSSSCRSGGTVHHVTHDRSQLCPNCGGNSASRSSRTYTRLAGPRGDPPRWK